MDLNKKLSSLQEISKTQLAMILGTVASGKHIVLDPRIIRPLERVCGVNWLKSNGIEKIFKLDPVSIPNFGSTPVFYMIFNRSAIFQQVIQQIRSLLSQNNTFQYHIIFVPKSLYENELESEEFGLLYNSLKLHSFIWMPIQLDTGILSLEIPYIYQNLFLKQDLTLLPVLANALWRLMFVVGKTSLIFGLGQYASAIINQLELFEENLGESDKYDHDFGCFLIMDRNVDYPSALLMPGTYAGLVNEVYGVETGVCELKSECEKSTDNRGNPTIKKQLVSFQLDSNKDKVYADIRNRYFTQVTSVLSNLTKELKIEKNNSKEMALDDMKRYVQTKLQATKFKKQCLTNHLMTAETIINVLGPRYEVLQQIELDILKNINRTVNLQYLEESLSTENDKLVSLRLFCLLLITQKLSESEINSFWRKFLHIVGNKFSIGYRNLINAGFIPEEPIQQTSQQTIQNKVKLPKFIHMNNSNFYTNVNRMKQIPVNPEKINLQHPTCSSYVFGGNYIPLVTQLTSLILNSVPLDEIKAKAQLFDLVTVRNQQKGYPLQKRSVLIYIIGGITYAEIAACNLLETLTGTKLVFLSDRIIGGNHLMQDILELKTQFSNE